MSNNTEEKLQEPTQDNTTQSRERGFEALKVHFIEHKIDSVLWITRALTLTFCISYLIPIFGNPLSCYQKALISSAATSALRLHQRVPTVQFSREFFAQLFTEDSAHYLLYSLIFMYTTPVTLALLPIFLFALLHFASYSLTLLDVIGAGNQWLISRFFISLVELQHRNILKAAACVEIFLMPLVIVFLFGGKLNILTPFIYYRFLTLRYASRRNPYTRTMFYELRVSSEQIASRSGVPIFLCNFIYRITSFISGLAPAIGTQ